jgi:hypothetical protein
MIAPASHTLPELVSLSQKPGLVARVITIDRKEFALLLDGHGNGEALSGQSSVGADGVTTRVPFDRLALVYYGSLREVYSTRNAYASLENVGDAEQRLDCAALELEIARAGAIRWYERRSGATPFTEHEARMQHGKNAGKYFANTLIIATDVMILAASGGNGAAFVPPMSVSADALRWRVTAADRRELGLLRLKRSRSCPATALPGGDTTDLGILQSVEATQRALDAHEISDDNQVTQETQLLDQFDPQPQPEPEPEPDDTGGASVIATSAPSS